MVRLVLVGDSDIAFWPKDLFPRISSEVPLVCGHSGATLGDIIPKWRRLLSTLSLRTPHSCSKDREKLVIVACAGENDIGNGISLDRSVNSLQHFLDTSFGVENTHVSQESGSFQIISLIFLGPKFEPWQEDDPASMKQYSKMSRSFARCCGRNENAKRISYVDCLNMFCGESASLPGATLAGNASAEPKYFASDQLHLNGVGYRLWKDEVEMQVARLAIP